MTLKGTIGDAERAGVGVGQEVSAERVDHGVNLNGQRASVMRAESVARSFGGVRAVDGVSLEIEPGRCIGLIGPNGAGKSTLLNLLAGSDRCDSGAIYVGDVNVTRLPAYRHGALGIIRTFQTASAFTGLTVLENVLVGCRERELNSFAGSFWPRSWRKREDEMIARAWALLVDIRLESKAELLAGVLSGGERRLVEIARVLMSKPKVLLLDEPTAGVSMGRIRDVEDHISRIVAAGVAVVLVEHELGVVDRLCDTVYVMGNGRIISSGSLSELRRREDVVRAYLQA